MRNNARREQVMRAVVVAVLLIPGLVQAEMLSVVASDVIGYQGRLLKKDGSPQTGEKKVTFTLYVDEQGGEPLWTETQRVVLTGGGYYTVTLGAKKGLPASVFQGESRWLGVRAEGGEELARRKIVPESAGVQATQGGTGSSPVTEPAEPATPESIERAAAPRARSVSWRSPKLLNGWMDVGGPQLAAGYGKDDAGTVRLQGAVRRANDVNSGAVVFQLPKGHRPDSQLAFPLTCWDDSGVSACELRVNPDGKVVPANGGRGPMDVNLTGISFQAAK